MMEVRSREDAEAFTTLDGSTIRVLLDSALGGAANQSLAEASLDPGRATKRHYHARSEEIYVFLEGGKSGGGRAAFVNAVLLRRGYARTLAIPPNTRLAARFDRLERVAMHRGHGLWSRC